MSSPTKIQSKTTMTTPDSRYWLDKPENVRTLRYVFYVVLALLIVPDLFIHKHTLFYSFEAWPGFYGLFGFISCVAIILVSKVLGYLLKRSENYYD